MAQSPSVGGAGAVPRGAVGKPIAQGSSSLTQLASPSATAARVAAAQAAAAADAAAADPAATNHRLQPACPTLRAVYLAAGV